MSKAKRGRPPVNPEDKRRTVGVSMSAIERGRYEARAQCMGVSLSQYLRDLADADCDDTPTTPHPIGPLPTIPKGA